MKKINKNTIFILGLLVIGMYIILPQIKAFHASLHYLSSPIIIWLVIALLFSLFTFFEAALSYKLLALKTIMYKQLVVIQSASMFVNSLLPAGIGGLGANFSFLRHKKLNSAEAASVITLNNSLGLIGHMLILSVCLIVAAKTSLFKPNNSLLSHDILVPIAIVIGVAIVAAFLARTKLSGFLGHFVKQIGHYRTHKLRLASVLLVQMTITVSNVSALYFSAKAVSLHLNIISALIIFTIGSSVKNATPTPGGVGGYEAALLAGFAAFKYSASHALAAILFFRLVNFWIPLALGLCSFIYAEKKKLYSSA